MAAELLGSNLFLTLNLLKNLWFELSFIQSADRGEEGNPGENRDRLMMWNISHNFWIQRGRIFKQPLKRPYFQTSIDEDVFSNNLWRGRLFKHPLKRSYFQTTIEDGILSNILWRGRIFKHPLKRPYFQTSFEEALTSNILWIQRGRIFKHTLNAERPYF